MKIILASSSPRRRELLQLIGLEPEILIPYVEEKLKPGELSPVFTHGGGVHLILLEEIREGQLMKFEDVKEKTN